MGMEAAPVRYRAVQPGRRRRAGRAMGLAGGQVLLAHLQHNKLCPMPKLHHTQDQDPAGVPGAALWR